MPRRNSPVHFPVAVLVDTREQRPYRFDGLRSDKKAGGGALVVEVKQATLPTGDYSLDGYTDRVAVERKSLNDLFHTLSQERDRFERELVRLQAMEFAAVMVEAEWTQILDDPPKFSHLLPKTVFRSVLAWQQRYPRVHWLFVPGREFAEVATFRVLQRFFLDDQQRRQQR